MPFFAPTQEEERSFLSVLRHTVLEGPLRLVRFTDSSRGHKAAYGRKDPKTGLYASYWMYASEVEELLESVSAGGPYGLKTIREVSVRWAICDDWGDLERTWVMDIPPGRTLNAYFGFAKFQPRISASTQKHSLRRHSSMAPFRKSRRTRASLGGSSSSSGSQELWQCWSGGADTGALCERRCAEQRHCRSVPPSPRLRRAGRIATRASSR